MRRSDLVAVLVLVLVAAAYVAVVIWGGSEPGFLRGSFDIYAAHYPSVIYALRSLRLGYGLLWNPFQNCGQPFLPSTLVGLLYPLHVLFLVLDLDTAYYVFAALHLAIGCVFMFLLCREHGLAPTGALFGARARARAAVRARRGVPLSLDRVRPRVDTREGALAAGDQSSRHHRCLEAVP